MQLWGNARHCSGNMLGKLISESENESIWAFFSSKNRQEMRLLLTSENNFCPYFQVTSRSLKFTENSLYLKARLNPGQGDNVTHKGGDPAVRQIRMHGVQMEHLGGIWSEESQGEPEWAVFGIGVM